MPSPSQTPDEWLQNTVGYVPNIPAAVIFCVLYALVAIIFTYQAVRTRTSFTLILAITALVECIGYATRIVMTDSPSLGIFIGSSLMILLAPNALALVNYKVLGQIIKLKMETLLAPGENANSHDGVRRVQGGLEVENTCRVPWLMNSEGFIRGDRIAKLFFASDVLAFLIQCIGGGQEAQQSTADTGKVIMLIGLVLQTLFYAFFAALATYVYRSARYQPAAAPVGSLHADKQHQVETACHAAFHGLFWTIGFLTIRNVYRLIEYAGGREGYVATHEAFMYIFDALIIFTTFGVFFLFKLGYILTQLLRQFEAQTTQQDQKNLKSVAAMPTAYSSMKRTQPLEEV